VIQPVGDINAFDEFKTINKNANYNLQYIQMMLVLSPRLVKK